MSKCKGIDDLLAAGRQPRRLNGSEAAGFFADIRRRMSGASPEADEAELVPVAATAVIGASRPPFPVDVFPETVATFARRVASSMGCPVDFPAVGILVCAGAAVGAARSIRLKQGWEERPGMYAVIVSRPGTMKTPALAAVIDPIRNEQSRVHQAHRAAVQSYKEALDAYKNSRGEEDCPAQKPAEPLPMQHLYANDTTVEALACNLSENPKGILIFCDELTAWVRSLDMYKGRGNDRQFFLSAWSGESVKVDRKSQRQSIVIPHPYISVLGGIQPDVLNELEAEGGREDGFIHRILFSSPPEMAVSGWIEAEIDNEAKQNWERVVRRLMNMRPVRPDGESESPQSLRINEEGLQVFKDFCNRQAAEMNRPEFQKQLLGPYSKLRAYCARFALVIHLLRYACNEVGDSQSEGDVDAEDVRRAVQLSDYFRAHALATYVRLQQTADDRRVDDLVAWMRRKGLASCTPRDVSRSEVAKSKKTSDAKKLLAAAADREKGDWSGSKFTLRS